jgi:hypothetical protein
MRKGQHDIVEYYLANLKSSIKQARLNSTVTKIMCAISVFTLFFLTVMMYRSAFADFYPLPILLFFILDAYHVRNEKGLICTVEEIVCKAYEESLQKEDLTSKHCEAHGGSIMSAALTTPVLTFYLALSIVSFLIRIRI